MNERMSEWMEEDGLESWETGGMERNHREAIVFISFHFIHSFVQHVFVMSSHIPDFKLAPWDTMLSKVTIKKAYNSVSVL